MLLSVSVAALIVFDVVDVDVIVGAVVLMVVAPTVIVDAFMPSVLPVLPINVLPSAAVVLILAVELVIWSTVGLMLTEDITPPAFSELKRISLAIPSIAML